MKWLALLLLVNFIPVYPAAEARLVVGGDRSDLQTLFPIFSLSLPEKDKLLNFAQGLQLDANDHLVFAALELEKSLEMGLSSAEYLAYNQELDRINLIQADAQEFSAEDRASPTMAKIVEASLTTSAFSAVQKILANGKLKPQSP